MAADIRVRQGAQERRRKWARTVHDFGRFARMRHETLCTLHWVVVVFRIGPYVV